MRRVEGEPARATIVAGVSGSPWGAPVINRAAAVAEEEKADLVVVHVDVADGLEHHGAVTIDEYRDLAEHSGGVFARVSGDDVPGTIAAVALEHNASRVVVARHRSRLDELVHGSVASRLRRLLPNVDVEEVRTGA
jgi:K+-sensing histidine kinase KdpD